MILALAELLEGTAKPVYQLGASDVNPCTVARFGELVGPLQAEVLPAKRDREPARRRRSRRTSSRSSSTEQRFDAVELAGDGADRRARSRARCGRRAPALEPAAKALEGAARREEKIADILKLFVPFTARQNGPFACANVRAAHARLSDGGPARSSRWAPETLDWPTG